MKKKITKLKAALLAVLSVVVILLLSVGVIFLNMAIPVDAAAGGVEQGGYEWNNDTAFDPDLGAPLDTGGRDFKILILTDQHYTRVFNDGKTDKLFDAMMKKAEPGLLILLGDQCFTPFNRAAYKHLIKKADSYKTPWAVVFGNHDEQGKATKNYLCKMLAGSEYCLFKYGPDNIGGAGNYFINLKNGADYVHTLYFLDTGVKEKKGYRPTSQKQIDWYEWAVNGITTAAGETVPSTMLVHQPLFEYVAAYDAALLDAGLLFYGERREKECPPYTNPGLFDKIKTLDSTKNVFSGHDHTNDYSVLYDGVRLSYSLSSGYGSYGDKSLKGGTVVTVRTDGRIEQENCFKR